MPFMISSQARAFRPDFHLYRPNEKRGKNELSTKLAVLQPLNAGASYYTTV